MGDRNAKRTGYCLWMMTLVLVVWAWYAGSVRYGLIWDDPLWYAQGANKTLGQIVLALDTYQFYRPMAILLNRMLTNDVGVVNAPLAHLIQIGAHTLNVVLVQWVVRRTGFSRLVAHLSATLFAFMPWAWQAVAWQAPQQPLTMLWVLLALASAQRFTMGHGRGWLVASWGCYAMGLGFQESALPMVGIMLMLAVARRRQMVPTWVVGHVGAAALYLWLWLNVPRLSGITGTGWDGRVLAYGLQGMAYPVGLGCGAWSCSPEHSLLSYGVTLVALAVGMVRTQGAWRAAWVALWLGAGFGPVWLGLSWDYVQIGERVLYPMAVGVAVLWAVPFATVLAQARWRLVGVMALLGMAVIVAAHLWPMRVLYERGTTLARHTQHVLASAEAPILFVNYPDRLRLKTLYPWGEWGLMLAPVVQNLSDYAQATLGRAAPSESRAFFWHHADRRAAGPYSINLRGVDTPAGELATLARTHRVWLTLYANDGRMALRQVGGPADGRLTALAEWPGVRLLAATLDANKVDLVWQRTAPVDAQVTVFVHLWQGDTFIGSWDGDVWDGLAPLADLPLNTPVHDQRDLPNTWPAGHYDVRLGLYHRLSGERVPVLTPTQPDQAIGLGQITLP